MTAFTTNTTQPTGPNINRDAESSFSAVVINWVMQESWWLVALRGVAGVAFGLVALFMPGITLLALILLFSAYMLVSGAFSIVAAVRAARQRRAWGLPAVAAVVDIVTGVLAFIWPGLTVLAFVLLIAAWAVVSGMLMLGAAFRLNTDYGRWWLALGGACGVAFGVLLIVAPPLGALVLTWWLGAFALAFGVVLIVLAFRLRSRHNEQPRSPAAQGAT
jgi:uncharacterized membrane protein HdeD (DUF308 family)